MYKIEKELMNMGFEVKRNFDSGVIVYGMEDDPTEVAVFTKHDPLTWEITTDHPIIISISENNYDKEGFKAIHRDFLEDEIDYIFRLREKLLQIENPWQLVEGE